MSYEQAFLKHMEQYASQAFSLNYQIANDPELSGEEYRACAAYAALCRNLGMEVTEQFAGLPTAFKANVLRAEKPVMKVALLAEYDALPGIGHGCGHSANGAMSFLAAAAFHAMDGLAADIDLIGTPDEELRGGKVAMCRQGIFYGYDLAVMVHVLPDKTTANTRFLALNDYRIAFHGKTAHASSEPWEGRNALNGAMLALHAIDMLRQHVRPETRIGTYIVHGGMASNVIPDYAEMECCVRHTERAYLNTVIEAIMKCCEGAAIATNTTYDVEQVGYEFDSMLWNEAATNAAQSVLEEMGLTAVDTDQCGSSDIGNVSYQCPTLHVHLAMGDTHYPGHSSQIADAVKSKQIEPIILQGAEIMGRIILRLYGSESLRNAVRSEFDAAVASVRR